MNENENNEWGDFIFLQNYHEGVAWLEKNGFYSNSYRFEKNLKVPFGGDDAKLTVFYTEMNSARKEGRGKWCAFVSFAIYKMDNERRKIGLAKHKLYYNRYSGLCHKVEFFETPQEAIRDSLLRMEEVLLGITRQSNEILNSDKTAERKENEDGANGKIAAVQKTA